MRQFCIFHTYMVVLPFGFKVLELCFHILVIGFSTQYRLQSNHSFDPSSPWLIGLNANLLYCTWYYCSQENNSTCLETTNFPRLVTLYSVTKYENTIRTNVWHQKWQTNIFFGSSGSGWIPPQYTFIANLCISLVSWRGLDLLYCFFFSVKCPGLSLLWSFFPLL